MEGTCNECVFPLTEEETESLGTCPTDTSIVYAACKGKLSCVKELIAAGADVNAACECHGNNALMTATWGEHPFCIIELIRAGADVNHQNKTGRTALTFVSDSGCLEELMEAGADVNIKDDSQHTPLVYAAQKGNVEIVKMLTDAGADVNSTCECHRNGALHRAVKDGDVDCLTELIKTGSDNIVNKKNDTPLMLDAQKGQVKCFNELYSALMVTILKNHRDCMKDLPAFSTFTDISLGAAAFMGNLNYVKQSTASSANVNAWYAVSTEQILPVMDKDTNTKYHLTPLMLAALKGHIECLKELIAAGSHINKKDNDGRTALMQAAVQGHVECLKELISAGADVNKQCKDQKSALHLTCALGHAECLHELLSAGADVEITDAYGTTPLLSTIMQGIKGPLHQGHISCVKQLTDAGADVNYQSQHHITALITAVFIRHVDIVKILLSVGADVNMKCFLQTTALMFVAVGTVNDERTMKVLIEAGADLNQRNEYDQTALLLSANQGKSDLMKILIEAGADVNMYDKWGYSALDIAIFRDNRECVKMIIEAGAEVKISSLNLAALLASVECLKELLGARGNKLECGTRSWKDNTISDADCEKDLTAADTDPNVKTVIEPLMHAVRRGKTESAEELLKYGFDVNTTDEYGNTALMTAIEVGSKPVFQLLVNWGAKVNTENNKGETALYLAVTQSHVEYDRMPI